MHKVSCKGWGDRKYGLYSIKTITCESPQFTKSNVCVCVCVCVCVRERKPPPLVVVEERPPT